MHLRCEAALNSQDWAVMAVCCRGLLKETERLLAVSVRGGRGRWAGVRVRGSM